MALGALVASPAARGLEPRFDHRGTLGLQLGLGLAHSTLEAERSGGNPGGLGGLLDLAGTWAVGDEGDELVLRLHGERQSGIQHLATGLGYLGYFGRDEWKTFLEVGLAAYLQPRITVGARLGLGLTYDFSPQVGLFASAAAFGGVGQTSRMNVELLGGLSLRVFR